MIRDLRNIVSDFLMPHWTTVDNNHVALMRELTTEYHLFKALPFTFASFAEWVSWHNDRRLYH